MKKTLITASLLSAAAAMPLLIATPAAAKGKGDKFNDVQKLGYVGKLAKNDITEARLAAMLENPTPPAAGETADRVFHWTDILLNNIALDHTPMDEFGGLPPFFQGGPGRTSRALAMTSIAIYDAANAFGEPYNAYNDGVQRAKRDASMDVAIAYAAYGVLSDLFSWNQASLDGALADDLAAIGLSPSEKAFKDGKKVGEDAAKAMLKARKDDNSDDPEPNFGGGGRVADGTTAFLGHGINDGTTAPPAWTNDPNTPEFDELNFNVALGAYWGGVTPFTLNAGNQFRLPPYPALGSADHIAAFEQVAALGGSPFNTNTASTSTFDTRFNGNYWGYDAVPLLGTPPRHYVQITMDQIKEQAPGASAVDVARMIAMINAAQGDSGVAAWDSKYYYNYWRPVTGVRRDDGVPETDNDPTWDPVGASIVNVDLPGEGFIRPTPPFPAYPSGHATFGAVTAQLLISFFGNDNIFVNISDEYNGQGVDENNPDYDEGTAFNTVRPLVPVQYDSYLDMQLSNGVSRIDNGVHWFYDDEEGQILGTNIVSWILNDFDAFQPND